MRRIAGGRSNRQIVAELIVADKTVINHMPNIFNKLGIDNGAAATAFAVGDAETKRSRTWRFCRSSGAKSGLAK